MWSTWRYGNGDGLMMKKCEQMTRCYNCLREFLMKLNVADRMSQHSTYVSWSMAKGNSRSCTDSFKLPLLSHLSQTFVTSCFKTWRKLSYNVHCKRKCSMSSMPNPQSQLLDASKPILCWWACWLCLSYSWLKMKLLAMIAVGGGSKNRNPRNPPKFTKSSVY